MSKSKSHPCRHPQTAVVAQPHPSALVDCKKCGAKDLPECRACRAGEEHDECAGDAS